MMKICEMDERQGIVNDIEGRFRAVIRRLNNCDEYELHAQVSDILHHLEQASDKICSLIDDGRYETWYKRIKNEKF